MEESPVMAPVAVVEKRQPPPERPEAISLRTKVILSFWAVILLLGLPTWLQTTSIYRASLPLEDMLDWAGGKNARMIDVYTTIVWVAAPEIPCAEVKQIIGETQSALDSHDQFPVSRMQLRLVQGLETDVLGKKKVQKTKGDGCGADVVKPGDIQPAMKIILKQSKKEFTFSFQPGTEAAVAEFPINTIPGSSVNLANTIHDLLRSERLTVANDLATNYYQYADVVDYIAAQPQEFRTMVDSQRGRAVKTSPEYHLSFSLFTAGGTPSSWDVQNALKQHIEPLTKALSSAAQISVTTQVQLYSSFSPSIQPQRREDQNGYVLQENDLTAFVNTAEWPLSPSIGAGPTLNFILYIPNKEHVPLTIGESQETSWLIPQWGSISILNPKLIPNQINGAPSVPPHLDAKTLQAPFETFASQLLSLLGVFPTSSYGRPVPLSIRLQSYKRILAFELFWKAAFSLGSLARLADHLNNIPIPKHVAQLVEDTRGNLTVTAKAFREGDWDTALTHAQIAYADGEKAFFDKSMVGQVYFPDEHKVAVYLPLLGPIGVPLLVSLIKEIRRFVAAFKKPKP